MIIDNTINYQYFKLSKGSTNNKICYYKEKQLSFILIWRWKYESRVNIKGKDDIT